ncbi:hypothetical protein pb186bvf_003467 [Paramecium bursaria]
MKNNQHRQCHLEYHDFQQVIIRNIIEMKQIRNPSNFVIYGILKQYIMILFLIFLSIQLVRSQKFQKTLAHDLYIYTKIAVCDTQQIENWNCGYFCDLLPEFEQISVIESVQYGALSFIGINQAMKRIIVSFRSTQNLNNFINDLKFMKSQYPCDGCFVHKGFLETYVDMQSRLLDKIQIIQDQNPSLKLTLTGHSLGGALATLTAIDLELLNIKVDTFYIFGSPRVGNKQFAQFFQQVVRTKQKVRITHHEDIVPHLPPLNLDYQHAIKEIWFSQDFKQYKECQGEEDNQCSNSVWNKSIKDHQSYFNINYKCNDRQYKQLTQDEVIL